MRTAPPFLTLASEDQAVPGDLFLTRLFRTLFWFNIAFAAFFVVAAWNNRLAIDDFSNLSRANEYGVLGGATWNWNHWTGRWAALVVINVFAKQAATDTGRLTLYTLLTAAGVIGSLTFLAGRVWQRAFGTTLSPLRAVALGTFACALLCLGTRNMGETWFWLSGSVVYLWPLVLLFVGAGLLLPLAQPVSRGHLWAASLCWAVIPFFNDSLTVVLLPLLAWLVWQSARGEAHLPAVRRAFTTPLFLPLVLCTLVWLVRFAAPGDRERVAAGGGLHVAKALPTTLLLLIKGSGYLLVTHAHSFLLAFLVGATLATLMNARPTAFGGVERQVRAIIGYALAVALLTLFPVALAYGFAVDRVYIHLTVAFVAASAALGATLMQSEQGAKRFTPEQVRGGTLAALWMVTVGVAGYAAWTGRTTTVYARAYDARWELLARLRAAAGTASASGQVVSLPSLPPSGPLHDGEILYNANHWINAGVRESLHLPFAVRREGNGIDPPR